MILVPENFNLAFVCQIMQPNKKKKKKKIKFGFRKALRATQTQNILEELTRIIENYIYRENYRHIQFLLAADN